MKSSIAFTRPRYALHKQFLRLRKKHTSTPLLTLLGTSIGPLHYLYYWYMNKKLNLVHAQSLTFGDNALLLPLIVLNNCLKPPPLNRLFSDQFTHAPTGHYGLLTTNIDPWDYRFAFEPAWVLALHDALHLWYTQHAQALALVSDPHPIPSLNQFSNSENALEALYQWIFHTLSHYPHAFFIDWHLDKRPRTLFGYFAYRPLEQHARSRPLPSHQQKAHDLLRALSVQHQCSFTPLHSPHGHPLILASSQLHFCSHIPSTLQSDHPHISTHFYGRALWDHNHPQHIHTHSKLDIYRALDLPLPP